MNYLIVFIGGGLGAMARHGVGALSLRWWGSGFPSGTLLVNLVGSLAMGMLVEHFALRGGVPATARLFLTVGVLGGFTTFSAFGVETVALLRKGEVLVAGLNVAGSVAVALAALWLGMAIAQRG